MSWSDNLYALVRDFYDLLLFHIPDEFSNGYSIYLPEKGSAILGKVLRDFRSKVYFTGFLLDLPGKVSLSGKTIRRQLGIGEESLIIVSRGGRPEYKEMIISSILIAKHRKDLFFIISCGPAVNEREFKEYARMAKGINNLKLYKIIYPDFYDYLRASDLSINMGGYNTMVRLLRLGKKSIIVPINNTEQPWNAHLLSRFVPSEILTRSSLRVNPLEGKINRLLKEKKSSVGKIKDEWFSGLGASISRIAEFM